VRADGGCAKGFWSPGVSGDSQFVTGNRQSAIGNWPLDLANERPVRIERSRPVAKRLMPGAALYRFAVPRTIFFTLRFAEPRAYSRGFSGLSAFFFLRTARFAFFRSSLLKVLVFAMSAVCFSSEKLASGF
jgi:hypothetical protein